MKKLASILLCCLLPWFSALADTASNELSALLGHFSSIQANFTQQIMDGQGNIVQKSSGKMQLKRPGLFRWETKEPTAQLIIANDNDLWVYDPDLEQATVQDLQQVGGNAPAFLLSGSMKTILEKFEVSLESSKDQDKWFRLTPKQNKKQDLFQWIDLHFNNGELAGMRFQDSLNQLTELKFSDIKLNKKIPEGRFVFNPPEGVDVIRNSNSRHHL